MKQEHYIPEFKKKSFHCPHCGVYSQQTWAVASIWGSMMKNNAIEIPDVHFSFCSHCEQKSIWFNKKMIEPNIGGVPLPNQDLSKDIKDDYYEASDILNSRSLKRYKPLIVNKIRRKYL